jgi:hypothetical protein
MAVLFRTSIASSQRHATLGTAAALLALTLGGDVGALDNFDLQIERLEGAGWTALGTTFQVELPQKTSAHAFIAELRLTTPAQTLRNVRIDCPLLELSNDLIACRRATILASATAFGPQRIQASLSYQRVSGALDLDLQNVRFAGGTARIRAALQGAQWKLQTDVQNVGVEAVLQLARSLQLPLPALSASGSLSGMLQAAGGNTPMSVSADIRVTTLTANNAAGNLATDKLSLALKGSAQRHQDRWRWRAAVESAAGQVYAEPVFLDFGVHSLRLTAHGEYGDDRQLNVRAFDIEHRQVLAASGVGRIDFTAGQPVRDLDLTVRSLEFPGAYVSYLQPLLLDTNFQALTTSGSISGRALLSDGVPQQIDLQFERVSVDDNKRALVVNDLSGTWHWLDDERDARTSQNIAAVAPVMASQLSWAGGAMLNLDIGPGELRFSTQGRDFRLLEATRLPLLDGVLELDSFRVRNAGLPTVAFMVDAQIQPISVQRLSKAFGWPEFGGSIGGPISKLRMREGVITLGAALRAQVFNGEVAISELRLEQPFGNWPRFAANIALDNLDLEPITSAFEFGRITGRISGAINGLRLFNWQPVAFTADLHTPVGDRSRHRISQRAVENIGSIGGGGAGITQALSSGLLRYFEDFNYDRLGISCRLENDICHMDGVAAAPHGGYYLVKGKGLPRIDVIGDARRVDWPRLLRQLIAITQSGGPVVR